MHPVEIRSLSKIFETRQSYLPGKDVRRVVAVDDVSFSVKEGEILSILGPNGAGKTTLIKMLCTLIEPTSGEAYIAGFSIRKSPEKVRENLGVMLTGERTLYWKLTGRENLEYFAALYHLDPREAKKRIANLLDVVGLKDSGDALVENYSTGMKIRLSLAKSLLNDAPVLLLDEPTLSLDPQSARLMRKMITDLKKEGRAILLTTHFMEEADVLSDRVAIIDHGRVVTLASPSELKHDIRRSNIIEVESTRIPAGLIEEIKGLPEVSDVIELEESQASMVSSLRIRVKEIKNAMPSIMTILIGGDAKITNVRVVEPTLEDVFIELTGRRIRD